MPKARPIVASFWVLRPEEHPEAEARNYPGMLRILQASCERFGMRHVVLTDVETRRSPQWPEEIEAFACHDVPAPLMRACTELQARWLETQLHYERIGGGAKDTLFVGADCIFVGDPLKFYPPMPGLCVTYRDRKSKDPINTGAQMIRRHSIKGAAALYRRIADRCGTVWCDDQRAIQAELEPMPLWRGIFDRAGIKVAFLPMARFNVQPTSVADPCLGTCMLHFRGKARKQFFFDWAAKHGYA